MFRIQGNEIDVVELRKRILGESCGAFVAFEGWVRNHHEGRAVRALKYTHHPVLAQKEGERVVAETLEKFEVTHALAVHRVGDLSIGDCAVVTLVSSSHREEAFAANRFLIDSIKSRVPIWKHESYVSGEVEWTAPRLETGEL